MRGFWRWAGRLQPLANLTLLCWLLTMAVLGAVVNWSFWWVVMLANSAYLIFTFWTLRYRTRYTTRTIEIILIPSEEEPYERS